MPSDSWTGVRLYR